MNEHTYTRKHAHIYWHKNVCACALCMFEREDLSKRVYVAINIVRVIVYYEHKGENM